MWQPTFERLDRSHAEMRVKTLKEFEQERQAEKAMPAKDFASSWKEAMQRTARQEKDRDDRDLGKDLDK